MFDKKGRVVKNKCAITLETGDQITVAESKEYVDKLLAPITIKGFTNDLQKSRD